MSKFQWFQGTHPTRLLRGDATEQPHQLQGGVFGVGDVGFRASTQPTRRCDRPTGDGDHPHFLHLQ